MAQEGGLYTLREEGAKNRAQSGGSMDDNQRERRQLTLPIKKELKKEAPEQRAVGGAVRGKTRERHKREPTRVLQAKTNGKRGRGAKRPPPPSAEGRRVTTFGRLPGGGETSLNPYQEVTWA